MSNILCLGCSNSSTDWGKSWPDFLSEKFNYNLIRASSNGAGNSFFIEKLHALISENDISLAVVQLTEPSRVVTGMTFLEPTGNLVTDYNDSRIVNDMACYTWNVTDNETNLYTVYNQKVKIDHFWIPNVALSKWTEYKVMQDILTMQYLCDSFNVPVVFWSWFVPMEKLFIAKYDWLKEKIKWIPGCASKWLEMRNIPRIPNDSHYNSDAHKKLVEHWLFDAVKNYKKDYV